MFIFTQVDVHNSTKCCEISLTLLHRDAWHKLGDKSKRDCMLEYINRLLEIDVDWEEKVF